MSARIPPPPAFDSRRSYVESLHQVSVWHPYVAAVLAQHGIAGTSIDAGFVGKYPTFLVAAVVVKLFGRFPTWHADHAVEFAMQQTLDDRPEIPAPRLIAHGSLYPNEAEPWPYLITERLVGTAWRDVRGLTGTSRNQIAGRIGEIARTLHELPVPAGPPFDSDWLTGHGDECGAGLRVDGSLPAHLIDQIDDYVIEPDTQRHLTHGDLTADHVFIAGDALTGIIDWGDAQATDAYYELGPLFLGAFSGDSGLLRAFLAGYGWPDQVDFAHRAMSVSLMHRKAEFLIRRIRAGRDLSAFATLDDLAEAVWLT